jgi:hypothetical protein
VRSVLIINPSPCINLLDCWLFGRGFNLFVQIDRVFLQLGDMGISIDFVHAPGRMPSETWRQFIALEQHYIGPAELRKVVQNGAADYSAANDNSVGLGSHVLGECSL